MANLVEKLAQSVTALGVKASYGEPLTVGGVEIIPVAIVQFGFGGGSDAGAGAGEGEAGGGGGGGASIPVGAYVGTADGAVFKPNPIALMAVLVPLVWVSGRAIGRIVRALKK